MKGLRTVPRVLWPVAAALFTGVLLGLPGSTNEIPMPSAPTAPHALLRSSGAPAAPLAAHAGRFLGPHRSASPGPIDAGAGLDQRVLPAVGGMLIGIDPETGKLGMPTREQWNELSDLEQQRLDHSSAGLVEVHYPDGSVSEDLQGRFQEFATVRIGPDGKLVFQCVDGAENAERALKGPILGPAEIAPARSTPARPRIEAEER